MRLASWPRMPYLNDELREWIAAHLATLGVEEIALYAVDPQRGQDEERRVLVATEVGLIDGWYAPRGESSARYGFTARIWPWQAVRGVDLRAETYRVWALEHRTRWWLRLARPAFESETDAPELGAALCDFAKVCAVMAEPAGWQAAQEEVPVRREGLRVLPEPTEVPPEAGTDVEAITPTGRPVVPPPVVGVTPRPDPQPLRADTGAPFDEAQPEHEPEPDIGRDEPSGDASPAAEEPPESGAAVAFAVTSAADEATPPELDPVPEGEAVADAVAEPALGAHSADSAPPAAPQQPSRASEPGSEPAEPAPTRLGPLFARRDGRAREQSARDGDRALDRNAAIVSRRPDEATLGETATATLPPGEEPVDLEAYLPGEEPINLDDYDPDPLGLDGPLRDR